MKSLSLIFYAENGDAAKALAVKLRLDGKSAQLRQMVAYDGEVEMCDSVIVLSDVSPSDRSRIEAAFGEKVQRSERSKLTLPPPPNPKGK